MLAFFLCMVCVFLVLCFFFSSRRRHTRCALVTGVQACALPIFYDSSMDVVQLRARVGMVFQKPNPFPKSIFENVAYGPRIHGLAGSKAQLDAKIGRASCRERVCQYV